MKLVVLGIIAFLIVGYTAFTMFKPGQAPVFGSKKLETTYSEPMRKAKQLYKDKKAEKTDFSQSPCLSEDIGDGWSVDIVNNPRTTVDDRNVCTSFQEGKTTHIIEMNPDGNIERII
jgi:hypothetical protein